MTYEDDLDLVGRLRRISEDPEPDVPGSLYRYLDQVAEGTTATDEKMGRISPIAWRPQSRRSRRSQALALLGVAAVLVVAVVAGSLLIAVRGTGSGATQSAATDRWTGLEWHDITATSNGLFADEPQNGGTYSDDAVLAWPGGLIAIAQGGLWTSTDGLAWKRVPGAPPLEVLAAMGGRLVGFDGTHQGWTSTDGVTWQSFSVPFAGTMFGTPVATSTGVVLPTTTDPGPGLTQPPGSIAPYAANLTVLYATADGTSWSRVTVPDDLAQATNVQVSALEKGFLASGVVPDPNGTLFVGDGTTRASERYWSSPDGFTWSRVEMHVSGGVLPLDLPIYVGRLGYESTFGLYSEDGVAWTRDEGGWTSQGASVALVADGQRILIQNGWDPIFTVGLGDGNWQTLDQGGDIGSLPGGGRAYLLPKGVLYASGGRLYFGQAMSGARVAGTVHPAATITVPPASPGSPRPTVSQPPATAWSAISGIRKLAGGPSGATSVTRWKGGYVAMRNAPASGGLLAAWTSPDRVTWNQLPDGTFGKATTGVCAQDADQVVVATWGGENNVWVSRDGSNWTKSPGGNPPIGDRPMVGNSWGMVALMDDPQYTLFSDLGNSAVPNTGIHSLHSVAVSGYRWVVVGQADGTSPTTTGPAAWWSDDGVRWTAASMDGAPGDGLVSVVAGRNGFVGSGSAAGSTAGSNSFWTSSDGKSWHLGTAMGPFPGAAKFTGDGTHIIGWGIGSSGKLEFWTSMDGQTWTQLALSGDATALLSSASVQAYPLDDGVLFVTPDGAWFGQAVVQK